LDCGQISNDRIKFISDEHFERLGNRKLQYGDIAYCIRGSVGKFGLCEFKKGAIGASLAIIRLINDEQALKNYLIYCFMSKIFEEQIKNSVIGTAQLTLSAENFANFYIPIPPLADQKRIVDTVTAQFQILDAISSNITN
jgi:type I restriction enzyme S subunit